MKKIGIMLVVTLTLFIGGLYLIFSSVALGQRATSEAVRRHGESMASSQMDILLQSSIDGYRQGGIVLAAAGGLGSVVFGAMALRRKQN